MDDAPCYGIIGPVQQGSEECYWVIRYDDELVSCHGSWGEAEEAWRSLACPPG